MASKKNQNQKFRHPHMNYPHCHKTLENYVIMQKESLRNNGKETGVK